MRAIASVVLALLGTSLSGCVIDSTHVRTELIKICTEDLPLGFAQENPQLAVARLPIGDVGGQVDDNPGARAELESVVFGVNGGLADFSFAESVRVELLAPSSALPDVEIAEDPEPTGETPMVALGDRSVNLVDYLVTESVEVRFEIAGSIPSPTFSTLFSACLDVEGVAVEDIDE